MNDTLTDHPHATLRQKAESAGLQLYSTEFASLMDKQDPLFKFRRLFCYPKAADCPSGELVSFRSNN